MWTVKKKSVTHFGAATGEETEGPDTRVLPGECDEVTAAKSDGRRRDCRGEREEQRVTGVSSHGTGGKGRGRGEGEELTHMLLNITTTFTGHSKKQKWTLLALVFGPTYVSARDYPPPMPAPTTPSLHLTPCQPPYKYLLRFHFSTR
ncbi:hypothetical protein E2C01_052993 [Portunus trituberculatus]|uniref:Uncharacterized protein n=1 Tax=Portunus trituberculatus TaxID=210409 RepID=A0A5B7GPM5_PORTR|nr:hypothetical protein [Portunus trituberculatus]